MTIQFVYELLRRSDRSDFENGTFEEYWSPFWGEIENPEWTYYSVANLQNFDGDFSVADMGDGISIRGRDFDELRELLGWSDYEL